MATIAGVYYFGTDHDPLASLERMLAVSGARTGREVDALAREGAGAIAHVQKDNAIGPPSIAQRDGVMVVVDGAMYDRLPNETSAAVVLDRYRSEGASFVRRLRGCFALAVIDTRERRVIIANDRLGMRRLHYRVDDHMFAFATDARALAVLGGPPTPNLAAISDFLTLGYPFGAETFFDGIELVDGGQSIEARDGKAAVTQYWQVNFGENQRRSPDAFADELVEAFTEAIDQMVGDASIIDVPLSGGLDSRCIAAALHRLNRPFRAYTIGSAGADDPRIAAEIANALDVEHQQYDLIAKDSPVWATEGAHLSDGMLPAFDSHILHIAKRLPADGQIVLNGASMLDGFFSRFHVPLGRLLPRLFARLDLIRRIFPGSLFDAEGKLDDQRLFAQDFRQVAEARLEETLNQLRRQVFEGYSNGFDVLDHLTVAHRMRRLNATGAYLLSNYRQVELPFFHPDVVDIVQRIPPQYRGADKPLVARMITRMAPSLREIPYERTGMTPEAGTLRLLAAYGGRKMRETAQRWIPGYRAPRREAAIDYPAWAATSPPLQDYIRRMLLEERSMTRGLFNPDALRAVVDAGVRGDGFCFSLISRLISVELWHRRYVDEESSTANAAQKPAPVEKSPFIGADR